MSDISELTTPPNPEIFFSKGDLNDPRLGEIVTRDPDRYANADIVILGCPQDEGVRRNNGRVGAASAPNAIREQFYRLTPFNIKKRIHDAGDVRIEGSLEDIQDAHTALVTRFLRDGKRVIVLGGGNDISFADGRAMGDVFGPDWWIGVNVDSNLDVRADKQRNSGTPYRDLLDGGHLLPRYFY